MMLSIESMENTVQFASYRIAPYFTFDTYMYMNVLNETRAVNRYTHCTLDALSSCVYTKKKRNNESKKLTSSST